jgi:hypothetical protein
MEHFELEIVLPVSCSSEKYRTRLKGFQELGLLNLKDHKVLVTLLIGKEEESQFLENWPNVTVRTFKSNSNHEASKVYTYFAQLTEDHVDTIDWLAKIDDDSANDIDSLLTNLRNHYVPGDRIYAVTRIMQDIEHNERELLRRLGHHYFFANGLNYVQHEHEGCVVSQSFLKDIVSNSDCMKLFAERAKIEKGFTDQCLGIAARMIKCHPVKAYFMSSNLGSEVSDPIWDIALFGGFLSHYHPVSKDKNQFLYDLMFQLANDNGLQKKNYQLLSNKHFFYIVKNGNKHEYLKLRLNASRRLEPDSHRPEKIWFVSENKLIFLDDKHNSIMFEFGDLDVPHICLIGNCSRNPNLKYVLCSNPLGGQ